MKHRPFNYNPPDCDLRIIHQDQYLLVLSKPSGLLSVPGKLPGLTDCLVSRAQAEYPNTLLVHRLDHDTSGIFVMAMNKDVQGNLGKQFERRKVKKTYIADVWGVPNETSGLIDLPLRCDWDNRPRQMVCHEQGRSAQTHWEVLETFSLSSLRAKRSNPMPQEDCRVDLRPHRNDADIMITRMKLTPVTGRSHQLRVHMLELGHPILGDPFYAHEEAFEASDRLHLHAQSITLHHPDGGDLVTFTDEVPF